MKRWVGALAAAAIAAGCSDQGGVDPDAIDGDELFAVQTALQTALASDPLYPTLAQLVFPFIDRASHLLDASGDTTRLVGIEMDIFVETDSTPIDADFTTVLAWTDYRPDTRTVDSVFFAAGAGRAPITATLGASFSPDTAGSGTAFVIHTAPDTTYTLWRTGTGRLITTRSSYGAGRSQQGGGLTLTVSRGTLSGSLQITAAFDQAGGAPEVATFKDFPTGARAVRVVIRSSP